MGLASPANGFQLLCGLSDAYNIVHSHHDAFVPVSRHQFRSTEIHWPRLLTMTTTIAGKPCGRIGFGMISLMHPGRVSTEDAIEVLHAALEAGSNLWNAGEHYGGASYNSLHLIKAYFTKYPKMLIKSSSLSSLAWIHERDWRSWMRRMLKWLLIDV